MTKKTLCIKCGEHCDTIIGSILTLTGAASLEYEVTDDALVIHGGGWLIDMIYALVGRGWYTESRYIEVYPC